MKHRIELQLRTSFQYTPGWAGELDSWSFLTTASASPRRLLAEEDRGSRTYTQRITLTPQQLALAKRHYRRLAKARGLDDLTLTDVLEVAIENTLSTSYCRHEHDCCGCWSTYAHATRVKPREFTVCIHATANL